MLSRGRVVAAAGGMLMCGARSPLVLLALTLAIAWLLSRLSLTLGLVGVVLVAGGRGSPVPASGSSGPAAWKTPRWWETDSPRARMRRSWICWDATRLVPGWGPSAGTSIPYFLADMAPEPIGMENEYGRILVDQGWVGLGGWLAFLVWLFVRPPPSRPADPWRIGVVLMYSLTLAFWVSAFIGTGMLSSVPGTVLLLTQMGVLVGVRARGAVPEAVSIRPGAPSEGGFSSPFPFAAKSRGRGTLERPQARSGASAQNTPHPNPPPQGGREME